MNKVINMLFCMAYLMDPYTCVMKGIRNISTFKQFNIFLLGCRVGRSKRLHANYQKQKKAGGERKTRG